MKPIVSANSPSEYLQCLNGWRQAYVRALWEAVAEAAPDFEPQMKWGHLVFVDNGPVCLIRAEERRVLFGFWRGQRLMHIEPRLKPGGKYEMATLELNEDTHLDRATVLALVQAASRLQATLGDATVLPHRAGRKS